MFRKSAFILSKRMLEKSDSEENKFVDRTNNLDHLHKTLNKIPQK